MRRRILVPIRDEPELTEDAIRNSLLNWLSQPVVSASSTSNPDSDLIRIYAARNLNENGRATMVHPFKTCRINYEVAKAQLLNIFTYALDSETTLPLGLIKDSLKWSLKTTEDIEQLVLDTPAPGNKVLATIEIIEPELTWIEVTQAIKDSLSE